MNARKAIDARKEDSELLSAPVPLDDAKKLLWQRPGYLLRRCLQHTSGVFEESCADQGITARQYDYLFLLNLVSSLGQTELAEVLGMDRSTNTLVLKILERKKLVKRDIVANDTRKRTVRITAAGRVAYESAHAAAQAAIQSLNDALEPKEFDVLVTLLRKVALATIRK